VINKYNIIGIGNAGCNIASLFSKYSQYAVYRFDVEGKGKKLYKLPLFSTMEEYEEYNLDLKQFFKSVKGEVIVFISGGNRISGCLLKVLEHIKHCFVTIIYIKPEMEFLDTIKLQQHNVVYNVIQQYARSALFKQVMIIQNSLIEQLLGGLALKDYMEKINEFIFYVIHTINCFDNSKAVVNNFSNLIKTARIGTYVIMDFESGIETPLFLLDNVREKRYYLGVGEKQIESDNQLSFNIKKQMKEKMIGEIKISYSIYSVEYEKNIAIGIARSSQIQK